VDLSGCEKIQSIVIQNCSMFGDLSIDGMDNLETVTFVNCPQARNVTINNCPILKKVMIESCEGLSGITITNCKALVNDLSITSCSNLKNINVSNNINLTKMALNFKSNQLSNIVKFEAYDTKLKQITNTQSELYDPLSPTNKIAWKGEDGHLDFRFCSTSLNINLSGNTEVQFIHLRNDKSNPITLNNSFYYCKNLERIYGHFKLVNYSNSATDKCGTFRNCYKFSIHGQIDTNSRWRGNSILSTMIGEQERIKTCWEIIDNIENKYYDPATKNSVRSDDTIFNKCFATGEGVTNITFAEPTSLIQSRAVSYAFANTKITQFDIYYFITMVAVSPALSDSTNVYNWDYTFYCSKNESENYLPNDFLNWETKNELNRYTFYRFNRMKSGTYFIHSTTNNNTPTYLYAPQTINGVFKNNGVLSPLTNLTSFSVFVNRSIVTTRNLFFVGAENTNANSGSSITSIDQQSFAHIFYDETINFNNRDYDITDYSVYSGFNENYTTLLSIDASSFSEVCGNLSNFFQPLTKLANIYSTMNLRFINYGTLTIPKTVVKCSNALSSTYGYGKIDFNFIFPSNSNVTDIASSFNVNNSFTDANGNVVKVKFELENGTFKNLTKLQYFGMSASWPSNYDTCRTCHGNGVDKHFYDMPYNILENLTSLIICNSLFEDAKYSGSTVIDENTMPELPGSMFYNNVNLTHADKMFYGIQIPYKLTSESFARCSNLKSVSYCFANKYITDSIGPRGSIPYKLLYHGHTVSEKTIRGTNSGTKPGESKYQITSQSVVEEEETKTIQKVTINGTTYSAYTQSALLSVLNTTTALNIYKIELDSANSQFILNLKTPTGFETKKWSYNAYNKNIVRMNYLFSYCIGLSYYENDDYDKENNENHNPYNWYISSNTWVKNEDYELTKKEFDISWSYDGQELDSLDNNTLCYDKDHRTVSSELFVKTNSIQVQNFCCPPDLFRYCKNSGSELTIEGVFNYCGSDYGTNSGGYFGWSDGRADNRGLCGKIPSILLKPISNVTSIKNLFRFCRHLSSYKVTDGGNTMIYLIPKDFFKYAVNVTNLYQSFQGMDFAYGNDFNVFRTLKGSLDIRKMFANSTFGSKQTSGTKTISGIFTNNKFSQIAGVFSFSNITEVTDENGYIIGYNIPQVGYRYGASNSTKISNLFDKNLPETTKITHVYYGWGTNATDSKIPTGTNYYNY
jgi:hypothetical protein